MEKRSFPLSEVRFINAARSKAAEAASDDMDDTDEDEDDDEDRSLVVGYAAPFNANSQNMGGYTEQLAPGVFTRSLSEASAGQRNIVVQWEHDMAGVPLASTKSGMSLEQDAKGLKFSFDPKRLTTAQADAIATGDMQVSVGFFMNGYDWSETPAGDAVRTVTDLDLVEFSFVLNPAYTQTEASMRSFEVFKEQRAAATIEAKVEATVEVKAEDTAKIALRNRVTNALFQARLYGAKSSV